MRLWAASYCINTTKAEGSSKGNFCNNSLAQNAKPAEGMAWVEDNLSDAWVNISSPIFVTSLCPSAGGPRYY